jgi:phosphoesterase RecJ-like protein
MVENSIKPIHLSDTIRRLITDSHRIAITTHVNPDGDAIGSEVAFAAAMLHLGKQPHIINHNSTPDNYKWLDPEEKILHFIPEKHRDYLLQTDLIAILDTNQPDRLRSLEPFVRQSPAPKLIIDHHLDPHPFGDHYIIDEDATSTGELVYKLLRALDIPLTHDIATALYTAIMTDTGSFRFPRTDPEIHYITGDLLGLGVDPTKCFVNVYEQWTPNRMRLLGEVLDSMRTAYDGKVAYVVCTQNIFQETATTEVETDNFTTYPMSIQGVVVGILFNELPNGVKISFRSKGAIPINQLAAEFGGGGHLNAAGARIFNRPLQEVVNEVVEKTGKYLSYFNYHD